MKLRVVHLIRKLDKIDRDLEELGGLRNRIQEDREYAGRLSESVAEETTRLKRLRSKILAQVIRPPATTSEGSSNGAGEDTVNGPGWWRRLLEETSAPSLLEKSSDNSSGKSSGSNLPEIILPGASRDIADSSSRKENVSKTPSPTKQTRSQKGSGESKISKTDVQKNRNQTAEQKTQSVGNTTPESDTSPSGRGSKSSAQKTEKSIKEPQLREVKSGQKTPAASPTYQFKYKK